MGRGESASPPPPPAMPGRNARDGETARDGGAARASLSLTLSLSLSLSLTLAALFSPSLPRNPRPPDFSACERSSDCVQACVRMRARACAHNRERVVVVGEGEKEVTPSCLLGGPHARA